MREAESLRDSSAYALLHVNLGLLEGVAGHPAASQQYLSQGIALLRRVIQQDPRPALPYFHLGNAYAYQGLQAQQQGGLVSAAGEGDALLQHARDAYQQASQREPANLFVRRAMAQLLDRWALRFTSTDPARAMGLDRQALQLLEELPSTERRSAPVQKAMAAVYGNLGWAQGQVNQFAEALDSLNRTLAIQRALSAADPEDRRAVYDLTGTLRAKGIVYGYMRRPADAIEAFREAAALHDQLLQEGPNPRSQYLRAELTWRISDLQALSGAAAQAEQTGRDALQHLQALADLPQPSPHHLREIAVFLLSSKVVSLRQPQAALTYARRAAAANAQDPFFREVLAQALIATAQWAEAEQVARQLAAEVRATVGNRRTRQLEEVEGLVRQAARHQAPRE